MLRRRIPVPLIVLPVVLVTGIGIGTLLMSDWVTPSISVDAGGSGVPSVSSNCNGWWPQWSYDGYFQCDVTAGCHGDYGGSYSIGNVTAPQASSVRVSPSLPITINCGPARNTTFHISGQLGYSGAVTILIRA